MIETTTGKCPKCGKMSEIVRSNNPLVPGLCERCIKLNFDSSDLKQANFFCRTYNIPFNPTRWVELQERVGSGVFKIYTQECIETASKELQYTMEVKDWWGPLDEEYKNCGTFEQLLSKIEPIKQKFIERNKIKWGDNYNFEEFIQLENLLVTTLRSNDISNPMQIDAIKKACKISVALDRAIVQGDAKALKDLSTTYNAFIKAAQIDEIITSANEDVIATVADLGECIEKNGGEFTYYDHVERDVVDKTINDLKDYVRTLVIENTGLGSTLEAISSQYKQALEQKATGEATQALSIEDIMKEQDDLNNEFDKELERETLADVDMEVEDEHF